ncbi:MAG: cytochrome c [Urechidicola sp.]
MKKVIKNIVVLILLVVLSSCSDKRTRASQYMPDMYVPVSYETYGENAIYENGMASRIPAEGTLARGAELPYDYENTPEGYELAKANLKNPLDSLVDAKRGKSLYGIYCTSCHGDKGEGQGELVKREKFLGIPNYKDRDLTDGNIYHAIMYGKNLMGSHSSQLTEEERWQIVAHVQELRNN